MSTSQACILLGSGALFILLSGYWLATNYFVSPVLQKFAFASRGKAKADLTQFESALIEYSLANGGEWPDNLEALVTPDVNGHTFIKGTKIPKDPWGNEYLYVPPGTAGDLPTIYTFGKDGRPGGEGDDADMDNHSIRFER